MNGKVYRFYVNGFSGTFNSLPELAAHVGMLKRIHTNLVGMYADIYIGQGTLDCAMWRGVPDKRVQIGA